MKIEHEYTLWNNEITEFRNRFHVLNLFTTQQLQVIRQQLGQLRCERITSLPSMVTSLLMSISPRICEKDIKECLQSVKGKKSLIGQHTFNKSKDCNTPSSPVDHADNVQVNQFNPENEVSINAAIEKMVMQHINQFNDVERDAYEELEGAFPDELIYLSIKNCSDGSMQQDNLLEDASAWCLQKVNLYVNKDPKVILNELQTSSNKSIKNEQSTQNVSNVSPVVESQHGKVYVMEQLLIENDIPSGLAHEAAIMYPDNVEGALTYCIDEQNKVADQFFSQLPSTGGNRYKNIFYM